MASQLNTVTSSGTQTTAQGLQAPVGSSGAAPANAKAVQPGTASELLNNTQGVALKGTQLSVVNLGGQTTAQTSQAEPPAKQHVSPVLFGFSGLLFVVAAAMFWATARSAKTTT